MKIIPTVLSGGSGTRLWPMSRSFDPKQLQPIIGNESLLAQTVKRLMSYQECLAPVVICNGAYADQVVKDLVSAGAPPSAVLEEPLGRDTAAAAAAAALWVREAHGEDAVVLLLPSDHYISDIPAFYDTITRAAAAAQNGYITTIGLKPTRPETGYGYIRRQCEKLAGLEAYPIAQFAEKPPIETAREYVSSGDYMWNSGMFVFMPSAFLEEMRRLCPDILRASEEAFVAAHRIEAGDGMMRVEFPADSYGRIPKNSIDFALMEHTRLGSVVEADIGWSDIGSWTSVHECLATDENDNANPDGAVLVDVDGSMVLSLSGRDIALAGVKDLVVVDTPDALLICNRSASQAVKAIHKQLDDAGAHSARLHGAESAAYEGYMRRWTRDWFFGKALPFWADIGMDNEFGGSFEAVDLTGAPMKDLTKRLRVQARQIYSFSRAYMMGWEPGLEAMRKPLEFMLQYCKRPEGGWISKTARNGEVVDAEVDAYDQAFVILALGWAAKASGDAQLLQMGEDTLQFVKEHMRHPAGGIVESLSGAAYRRANPHMHLLEASLNLAELHDSERAYDLSREIYGLYRSRFCVNGLLREYFDENLRLPVAPDAPERLYLEPGHLIEWAFLLRLYGKVHGVSDDTIATMSGFAERYGVQSETGFISDACTVDGIIPAGINSRLWPQTEAIRLWFDRDGPGDKERALQLLSRFKESYLTFDGVAPGYWRDVVTANGEGVGNKSPASSLYHIVGAVEPLVSKSAIL